MDAMKPSSNISGASANDINEDMRIENIKLKSHIITLEKEMHSHNQEIEIKTNKMTLKDKNTEQSVRSAEIFHTQNLFYSITMKSKCSTL